MLQLQFKLNSNTDKREEKLLNNKRKKATIEILKRIKKLEKSLRIQLKKWIKLQVKYKINSEQEIKEDKRETQETINNLELVNQSLIDQLIKVKKI